MAVTKRPTGGLDVYYGESGDTKPTTNVPPGAQFYESDTGDVYRYSGSAWFRADIDNPTGGEGGGSGVATLSGVVVAGASSTTPLTGGSVFESPWFAVKDYAVVTASVRTDQNSAASGFTLELSDTNDGAAVVLHARSMTVAAATPNQKLSITTDAAYARVRLVNGATDQTALNLTTRLMPVATTDFPSLGQQPTTESISIAPASDAPVFEIPQLHRAEDSITSYRPQLTVVGAEVTTDNTTLVAAPAAGSHLVVAALFAFRKETGTTPFDLGFRPGTAGADVFRPTFVAAGQMWQSNLGFEWHLASATALIADLPGGTLAGGGVWVTVAYETRPDS